MLLSIAFNSTFGEKFSYDGYHLIRVKPNTSVHIEYLKTSEHNSDVKFFNTFILLCIVVCNLKIQFKV